jgi:hypothetical protein
MPSHWKQQDLMPNDLLLLDNFIGFGKNGKSTKRLEDFGMDETLQFVKTHGDAATKEWKKPAI